MNGIPDRAAFARYAAPEAVAVYLKRAQARAARANGEVRWLERLLAEKTGGDTEPARPANDLSGDEPDARLVAEVANYVRQNREGHPLDASGWGTCTQADVDAARLIVAAARRHLLGSPG